jgi:adenylosuccinate lyase
MPHDTSRYDSPLASRYASKEMSALFSDDRKFQTWRRLWIELARAERRLGLPVSEAQIAELEAKVADIDYEMARREEK